MQILAFKIMFAAFMLLISSIILMSLFDFDDFPERLSVSIVQVFIFSTLVFLISALIILVS